MATETESEERSKYERMWARPEYRERSPGMRLAAHALLWLGMKPGQTLCDFGAGTGRAAKWFAEQGLNVTAFDIAENAITEFPGPKIIGTLWDMPPMEKFDYAFCCDVMEHIPTEHVTMCLRGIAKRTNIAAFFQIALFECSMGTKYGEHLHLTVKPVEWWRAQLLRRFKSVYVHESTSKRHLIVRCEP